MYCEHKIVFLAEKQPGPGGGKLRNGVTDNIVNNCGGDKQEPTWVHDIFRGVLCNETRCLNCETVSHTHYIQFPTGTQ